MEKVKYNALQTLFKYSSNDMNISWKKDTQIRQLPWDQDTWKGER